MDGNWTESKERIVRLPEDDPVTFEVYVNLAYTGLLFTKNTDEKRTAATISDELDELCRLYVLGEKLQDKAAKSSAVQALLVVSEEEDVDGSVCAPRNHVVSDMYHGTCSGSIGRRLMVDIWITDATRHISNPGIVAKHISDNGDGLPKEFVLDLAVALLAVISKSKVGSSKLSMSRYMEKVD